MGAAGYIGRVGALAVALGVGSAALTGPGVAWADDAGSSGSTAHATHPRTTTGTKRAAAKKQRPKKAKPAPSSPTDQATNQSSDTPAAAGTSAPTSDTKPVRTTRTRPARKTTTKSTTTPVAATTSAADTTVSITAHPTENKRITRPSAIRKTPAPATAVAADSPPATGAAAATAVTSASAVTSTKTATKSTSTNPVQAVAKIVGDVLNWAFNATPTNPAHPTLAWTLLAFARREIDNLVTMLNPQHAASSATSLAVATTAAAPGFPTPGQQLSASTSFVNWVTGNFPPNNTYTQFGVWGTDVGTMWDNGIADDPSTPINEHQILMAFGDTFSGANMTGTWRSNVLARSSDTNLADGITIAAGQWLNGNMFGGMPLAQQNYARQIILPERLPTGLPTGVTLIPTAGISVPTPGTEFGATQYLSFMSVKQWGSAGQWSTNYSAIAYSVDNGENWYVAPSSVRQNSPYGGNKNFQQSAFVSSGDGYVYAYGTPNGRGGSAYLSRVAEANILDASKYEYYSKGSSGFFGIGAYKAGWYKDPSKATSVFGRDTGACGVAKAGNHVSELSVQYNATLGKYVTLYCDQFNNVVMRTSDTPQGKWSAATVLLTQQNGGIYAPMLDPWSPSTLGTGTDLYWNLSLWSQYDVMLMKTDLTKV